MAPTAAMLILSRNSKSSSATSLPCAASSSGPKVSILKWVSLNSPISFNSRPDHKQEACVAVDRDHDTLEKRFKEALELSCW